ncbi:MAG: tetratricopeptide repeat protein [Armatimonadetes bacterium]|nr:tetratricopeptide repeat protein [Armatimonadota bacterium]
MESWVRRAIDLARNRQYAEALPYLETAFQRHPYDFQVAMHLGLALAALGETVRAEQAFRQAAHIHPTDSLAHYNLGCALHQQSKYLEAIAAYETALKYDPSLVVAQTAAANLRPHVGQPAQGQSVASVIPATSLRQQGGCVEAAFAMLLGSIGCCAGATPAGIGALLAMYAILKGARFWGVVALLSCLFAIGIQLFARNAIDEAIRQAEIEAIRRR